MSKLAFEVQGRGPGLMLVHGTGSTPAGTWGPCIAELAASHTVLAALPGSGDSALPDDAELNIGEIASQMADVAAEAGRDRFAIAGASLGGPIAVKVAAMFLERITHLVSVCGFARPRAGLRLRQEIYRDVLPPGAASVGRVLLLFGLTEEAAAQMPEEMLQDMIGLVGSSPSPRTRQQIALTLAIDVEADLALVWAPSLIIAGVLDRTGPFNGLIRHAATGPAEGGCHPIGVTGMGESSLFGRRLWFAPVLGTAPEGTRIPVMHL
ncbi:alpha/beta hydrolase [Streptomyces sp. SID3212]|uniref:alpha/beta fold hydrolase n=1 Tax=Streptomyces sp. SID3212 TaxID=2690259 RepID=UPI00136E9701|nr:alpha/beta hydrolase [Streptomyces sp. SID3212]MYV55038.1 alpha/beta fold hydrolase [Streptomyces sp. SID3212]